MNLINLILGTLGLVTISKRGTFNSNEKSSYDYGKNFMNEEEILKENKDFENKFRRIQNSKGTEETLTWAVDVHGGFNKVGTLDWAKECSFNSIDAVLIALGDVATDISLNTQGRISDNPETWINKVEWPNHVLGTANDAFHFNMNSSSMFAVGSSDDTRIIKYKEYFKKATEVYNNANSKYKMECEKVYMDYPLKFQKKRRELELGKYHSIREASRRSALNDLSTALHCVQDIYAHANVQSLEEHDSFRAPEDENKKVIDDPEYDIEFFTKVVTKVFNYKEGIRYNQTKNKSIEILMDFVKKVSYKPDN